MPRTRRPIYVRIDIRGPLDRVWELTQTPSCHRRWDLRFTDIDYLPRPDPSRPQRFEYATRIGFGLAVRGGGETVGERDTQNGARSSALRFWSDDPKSLIREGAGYWKYLPRPGECGRPVVRFLTRYDYAVRFGVVGRAVDRWAFGPLMAWATAWSFDRLRLWVEDGLDPRLAARLAAIDAIARAGVAFVWLYHGVVPKLWLRHADELNMLVDAGLSRPAAGRACTLFGLAEVGIGLSLLFFWRTRWPLWLTAAAMPVAAVGVAVFSPRFLGSAFNVVTLNLTTMTLAIVAWMTLDQVPTASRCVRGEAEALP